MSQLSELEKFQSLGGRREGEWAYVYISKVRVDDGQIHELTNVSLYRTDE